MKYVIPIFCILLGLSSCGADGPTDPAAAPSFFDLKGFFDAEIERLEGYPLTVTKSIQLNGETETQQLTDLNFSNDLRLFRESDINKPAWHDKYRSEVQQLSGQHQITTYTALDSSLQTRVLTVEEDLGVVTNISIRRKTGTVLSKGDHQLEYDPATGYQVRTVQINRLGKDVNALIEVSW